MAKNPTEVGRSDTWAAAEADIRESPVWRDAIKSMNDIYSPEVRKPEKSFGAKVDAVLEDVREILLAKNAAYGNSALDPVRIFSKADTAEQLRVRIDDKISRMKRGTEYGDEDTVMDLIGYLVILRIEETGE